MQLHHRHRKDTALQCGCNQKRAERKGLCPMIEEKTMESSSEKVRNEVLLLLADGKMYSRNEIVKFVRKKGKETENVTDGTITGVLKALVNARKVECVKRGNYRMASVCDTSQSMYDKVKLVLLRCKEEIGKCCVVNMLEISETEIETEKKVGNTLKMIDKELLSYEKAVEKEEKKEV